MDEVKPMDAPKKTEQKATPVAPAKGASVQIVLTASRRIDGRQRDPGYVLMEGVCQKNVTADDVTKAIAAGTVHVKESVF